MAKKWIAGAIKHPGALREDLGIPEGQKIPRERLEQAAHSRNPKRRARANLALRMRGFQHHRVKSTAIRNALARRR